MLGMLGGAFGVCVLVDAVERASWLSLFQLECAAFIEGCFPYPRLPHSAAFREGSLHPRWTSMKLERGDICILDLHVGGALACGAPRVSEHFIFDLVASCPPWCNRCAFRNYCFDVSSLARCSDLSLGAALTFRKLLGQLAGLHAFGWIASHLGPICFDVAEGVARLV